MSNETRVLSDYLLGMDLDDVPTEVCEHTKRLVLNLLAACLWGWATQGGPTTHAVLAEMGGSRDAAVVGAPRRLPAPLAAGANAALAFASKADDTHGRAFVHPGHVIIPTALAVGEARGSTGREVLAAIIAATEAGLRVARAVAPAEDLEHNSTRMGFWSEVKCAILAAMAAARLDGLTHEQTTHAIGIAATSSSGLLSSAGYGRAPHATSAGSVYAWDAGKAAVLGVLASRLAAGGMTAGEQPLEGESGWVRTYTGGHGRMAALTEGLGTEYETLRVTYKTRPMSHTVFASVDAVGAIVERERLTADEVAEIIVRGPAYLGQNFWRTRIETFEDAASSAPFAIAMNVVAPSRMTLPETVLEHLGDDRVHDLVTRCTFEEDPSVPLDAADLPGSVTVVLRDGRRLHGTQAPAEFAADAAVTDEDLQRKLARAAAMRLPAGDVTGILADIDALERLGDVRALMAKLQP